MRPSCPTAAPSDVCEVSYGLDRQHRAGGVEQHPLGVAAEDQLADRRAAAQADHDQLGVVGLGDADQVLGGLEAADELADLVLDAGLVELASGSPSISSSAARAARPSNSWPPRWELTTTSLRAAQLRLVDAGGEGGLALRLGDVSDDDGAHGVSSSGAATLGRWPAGTVHGNAPACGSLWRGASDAVRTEAGWAGGPPLARAGAPAPVDRHTHAASLRCAALALVDASDRRRLRAGALHVGRARGRRARHVDDPPTAPTHALRADVVARAAARRGRADAGPALWLTRPGELSPHDVDLRLARRRRRGPSPRRGGRPSALVVVTRHGLVRPGQRRTPGVAAARRAR